MKSEQKIAIGARALGLLLSSTVLAGTASAAFAQAAGPAAPPAPPQASAPAAVVPPAGQQIRSITVNGSQRIEADTVRSYIQLRVGDVYTQVAADQALRDLFETELFADVAIRNNDGAVVIDVKENPVINRVILEGNKRIKEDKILPEIRLAPRQIFTR
ncbi:MAG: POTRA domain-containing protein, partial [Pseudomonadota bacterium]